MPRKRRFPAASGMVGMVFLLSACASPPAGENHPYQDYLLRKNLEMPAPDSADPCRAYGCGTKG